MRRKKRSAHLACAVLLLAAWSAFAQDTFPIREFRIEGDTPLPRTRLQELVAPLVGPQRGLADLNAAVQALQGAFRDAGYGGIDVIVPEQELTAGVVTLRVQQNRIARVNVSGNTYFSEANIRASLPALQPGEAPNLRRISESVQLANDNPAKQVTVVLADGDAPGTLDARVDVADQAPLKMILTLDNSGTPGTGRWRTGVAVQHGNLLDRDIVATAAYTTSPDKPSGVTVNLYSLGLRVPLYAVGDSLDLIYGKSDVNTPASLPTLGGLLGLTGKGNIYALRWNHIFARRGETTSRVVVGLDRKEIGSRCDLGGAPVDISPPTPPIATCVPYTLQPLSVTYSAQTLSGATVFGWNAGLMRNIATGTRYTNLDGRVDRYSYLTAGNRSTRDGFMALRGGASVLQVLPRTWELRLTGTFQYARDPLPSGEQIGLAGASAVRGFIERAVSTDSGMVLNTELQTPDLAPSTGVPGTLRVAAFVDAAHGTNRNVGASAVPARATLTSAGMGLRYAYGRDVSLRLDLARVGNAGPSLTERSGDWRAHLAVVVGF
ncbi:ShlB/FhaC/HecB family hemolysin secretion/activation protein [Variovorax terrae]|uniref:ShlB/FhaC/HecB family hemolysin secretion/activation protein n=1 Tax=Variovorax terrae TaxID=2923278 RepID=A0A9X1VUE0_9BURK|nr:ShlB/FhaC/HecB family hemolysin secretion/activation protein [Variovorax terrae]MCJ0763420.1 ShlB/FhaC/HecB family hemolysin secretion/activation protein [Variovorax terrae]